MESLHAPYNVSDWIDILKIPCVLDNKRRKVRSYQLLIFSALFCVAIKKYKKHKSICHINKKKYIRTRRRKNCFIYCG